MKCGISTLQGPHQVAQKSSRITLPLYDDSETSFPATSFSAKFRFAALASAGHDRAGPASPAWPPVVPLFATSIDGCGLASHGICVVTVSAARPATPTIAIAHLSPVDIDVLEKKNDYRQAACTNAAIRSTSDRASRATITNVRSPTDQIAASCPSTSTSPSARRV